MTPTRTQKATAYCWQCKAMLRKIREAFDGTHDVGTALLVYFALTEIASDLTSNEFTTTHAWIAGKSGLSTATVKRRLAALVEIGVVAVQTPALRAPSNYRLLAHGELTIAPPAPAIAHSSFRPPRATLEVTVEESEKKESEKKGRRDPLSRSEIISLEQEHKRNAGLMKKKPEVSSVMTVHGIKTEGRAELDAWLKLKGRQDEIEAALGYVAAVAAEDKPILMGKEVKF